MAQCQETLELDPRFWIPYYHLAVLHASRDRLAEALLNAEKMYALAPWHPGAVGVLAGVLQRTGDIRRADALMQPLRSSRTAGASRALAIFHLICGQIDAAADWVAQAIEERDMELFLLLNMTLACALRDSARWPALARQMNLPTSR